MNTHKCDLRLARCYCHPRWKVTRADLPKRRPPWIAWAPFYGWAEAGPLAFRTHEEAVAYATAQARRASSLPSRRLTPATNTPKETP